MGDFLRKFLLSDDSKYMEAEYSYFTQGILNQIDKEMNERIKNADDKLQLGVLSGGVLGIMLSISLRRYVQSMKNISIRRCVIDIAMMTGGMVGMFYWVSLPQFYNTIRPLKVDLLQKNNPQYLIFLKEQWHEFSPFLQKEANVFRKFTTKDEFEEWWNDVPQYKFDIGEEPDLSKFTSSTAEEQERMIAASNNITPKK